MNYDLCIMYVKNLLLIIFFLVVAQSLIGQETLEEINKGWNDVSNYEKSNDPVGVLRTLVDMSHRILNSEVFSRKHSQSNWKIRSYELPMDTLESLLDKDDLLLGKAYKLTGLFNIQDDPDIAKVQLLKSLDIGKLHNDYHRPARWLAYVYTLQDDQENAVKYYKQSIEGANTYYEEDTKQKDRFLNIVNISLAEVHRIRRDFTSAEKCISKSMLLSKKLDNNYYLGFALGQKVAMLVGSNEFEAALALMNEYNYLTENLDISGKRGFYNNKAVTLAGLKRYKQAITEAEKANSLTSSMLNETHTKLIMAKCYYHLGSFDKSIEYVDEIIEVFLEDAPTNALAEGYFWRAKIYKEIGQLDHAKRDLKLGMNVSEIRRDMEISFYPLAAMIYLDEYEKSNDELILDSVQFVLSKTDRLIEELKIERRYFEDNINISSEIHDVYATNIQILSRLYEQNPNLIEEEKLFSYFENLKAYSLREQLKTDEAVSIGNIPESVLQTEKDFQFRLTKLQQQIYLLAADDQTNDQLIALQGKVSHEKEEYYSFLEGLEKDYPGYYKHEYKNKLASLEDLQGQLTDDYLLEYFVTEDFIFSILISADSYQLFTKEKPEDWAENVDKFQQLLHDPESSIASFSELSSRFYKLLIKDQLNSISGDINKLRIVPDALINFIPFEVLLTDEQTSDDFRKLPYLLKGIDISYNQSANSLVTLLKKENSKSRLNYAGFAPNYENDVSDSLSMLIAMNTRGDNLDLPFARESVNRVSKLMKGKTFVNNSATKTSFLDYAPKAKVIHLAMHGFIDLEKPSFSSLLFYGDQPDASLFSSEVYGLELKSDLAVLSACNTGVGKLVNGDGIQNMSRAFSFAGVKNTIMSLWSVPDIQTSQINYEFFQNIKQQLPIDEALTKSKLTYLENATQLRAHPYYWAGMVANGSMEPIQFASMNLNWPILLFVGIVLLLLVLLSVQFIKKAKSL